jgi:hypothetical protein
MAGGRRRAHEGQAPGLVKPSKWRRRRGPVEQLEAPITDAEGQIARPWRAVDTLQRMERSGSITPQMRQAGEDFRKQFYKAHLDRLHAVDLARPIVDGHRPQEPAVIFAHARNKVLDVIDHAGGLYSPAGSVLWNVVGWEQSLREWAFSTGWDGHRVAVSQASGILVAALGTIAKYYKDRE